MEVLWGTAMPLPLHIAPDLGTPPAFLMPGGSESAFPVERHLWTTGVRGRCDPPL